MKKELNISAILKDKPQGTKLYDLLYNIDVDLDTISTTDTETVVWCTNETDNNTTCHRCYSEFGTIRGCPDGLQILLPSKEMRDWRKFTWKKGDVLVNKDGDVYIIFERFADDTYCSFVGKYYLWKGNNDKEYFYKNERLLTSAFQKAGKDAAQTYINTVEERLGGKLNLETLEIEKQTEFKDGDIVVLDGDSKSHYKTILLYQTNIDDEYEVYSFLNTGTSYLGLEATLMDDRKARLATDSEKQQLFDALAKEGKRWNPDTKTIEDLPKKYEFKPFDKVLVRDYLEDKWMPNFFSCYDGTSEYKYGCIAGNSDNVVFSKYCIPYNDETKHLLGTTDEWKGGEG